MAESKYDYILLDIQSSKVRSRLDEWFINYHQLINLLYDHVNKSYNDKNYQQLMFEMLIDKAGKIANQLNISDLPDCIINNAVILVSRFREVFGYNYKEAPVSDRGLYTLWDSWLVRNDPSIIYQISIPWKVIDYGGEGNYIYLDVIGEVAASFIIKRYIKGGAYLILDKEGDYFLMAKKRKVTKKSDYYDKIKK
jgi:hypothetical protein